MKKPKKLVLKGLARKIRTLLAGSPSTAREVSYILDITPRQANVGIWMIQYVGQVHSTKKVPNNDDSSLGPKSLKLYELTPRGRAVHKSRDK